MHPNPLFRPEAAALLAEAERIGFAHIFAATADGPMVVHAPVTLHDDGLRFHVSRANRIVRHLEGAAVVASVAGPHGYVSANWYAVPGDQVPTWNYQTIEIDGVAHEKQLSGIRGFTIAVSAVRGTTKLSQNKTAADRTGVIAGFDRQGKDDIAAMMRWAAAKD